MSNTVDKIFAEVCLDERIKDGIFRMDEEEHMNALRDFFTKRGLENEAAVHITNRMVEGRFPERQAYNKDGILVTFPTPQHKAKAIQRGTHFEKNPAPQNTTPPKQAEPTPQTPAPEPKDDIEPKKEVPDDEKEEEPDDEKSIGSGGSSGPVKKIAQGNKELDVEPIRGDEKPEPPPVPQSPTPPPAPRTPERIAAEKAVIKQILATDDSALTNVANETLKHQLNEILKKCNEWGFSEAENFLKLHVK